VSDRRLTFVGECNPHHVDPRWALHPEPPYASGGQLCKILELNLCIGEWSAIAASRRAQVLLNDNPRGLVLLGRKVERAFFGRHGGPGYFRVGQVLEATVDALVLPHPSGLNRLWNEPGTVTQARRAFRRFERSLP